MRKQTKQIGKKRVERFIDASNNLFPASLIIPQTPRVQIYIPDQILNNT